MNVIDKYISELHTNGIVNEKGSAYLLKEMEVYAAKLKTYKRYLRYFKIKKEEVLTLKLLDLLKEIFTEESTRRLVLRLDYEKEIRATDPNIDIINLPPAKGNYRILSQPIENYKDNLELIDNKRSVDGLHITKTIKDLLVINIITQEESEIAAHQLTLKKLPSEALLFNLIIENHINKFTENDKRSFIEIIVYFIDIAGLKYR